MDIKFLLEHRVKIIIFVVLFSLNLSFREVFKIIGTSGVEFYFLISIMSITCILMSLSLLKTIPKIYFPSVVLFIFLFLSSFFVVDIGYGMLKAFLGILLPLTLFSVFIRFQWTFEIIVKSFVFLTLIIGLVAVLYKLQAGFWIRNVNFGVLGPIPFGWVNGFCFVLVGLKQNKKLGDYILMLLFVLMVLWTGSKGPLVGLGVVMMLNFNKILGNKFSTKIISVFLLLAIAFFMNMFADDIRSVKGIIDFFTDTEDYIQGTGQGSIGSRANYVQIALNMFSNNYLFGNGFGSFAENSNILHKYPHNIYAELLAESGLLSIVLFFVIIFNNSFKGIGQGVIFILVCLSFSGDFSYFRYAFYPLLISTYIYINKLK